MCVALTFLNIFLSILLALSPSLRISLYLDASILVLLSAVALTTTAVRASARMYIMKYLKWNYRM